MHAVVGFTWVGWFLVANWAFGFCCLLWQGTGPREPRTNLNVLYEGIMYIFLIVAVLYLGTGRLL